MPASEPDARSDLRRFRLRAMLTQEELALKAGIGTRTIRDIESGRARPQQGTLRLLVEALGLDEADRAALTEPPAREHPVPRELPRELATFAGRERELDALLTAVDGGATVVAVHGMAGVGKTSLAVRAAHALAPRYPDGQLFVDLLGFAGTDGNRPGPESVQARVLRAFDMDTRSVPLHADELAAAYRHTLAGRRVLLVLDNAGGADEVEALLPGTLDGLVLVASRYDLSALSAAHSMPLKPPPLGDAVAMIAAADNGRTTADEAAAIAERCGRLPLALGLAAARLRSRPSWSAGDLLRRLEDEERLLEELDMGHRGVAASLGASYCELDEAQRRMLRRLSLVPGADADVHAAAALCDVAPEDASAALESLVDVHLAESRTPGRYRLHDLVRLFAARLADREETAEMLGAASDRLLGVYLHFALQAAAQVHSPFRQLLAQEASAHELGLPGFDDRDGALSWFQVERGNLAAAVYAAQRAGRLESAWHLANAFTAFRIHDRDAEQHLAVNRTALDLARRLGDDEKTARTLSELSRHLKFDGRSREAIGFTEETAVLRRRLGDDLGVAMALRNIGILHRQTGRLAEALEAYESALAIAEPGSDTGAKVNIAVNMVVPLLALGRLEAAERLLADTERRMDADDEHNAVRIEIARGTLARRRGEPAEALATHTACLERCRRLGLPGGYFRALVELGEDLLSLNRIAEAVTRLHQAVEHAEEMAYLSYERTARNALGRALTAAGDAAAAIDQHELALSLAKSQEDVYEAANAHHGIADAYRLKGEISAARLHLRSAADGYAECGVPEAEAVTEEISELEHAERSLSGRRPAHERGGNANGEGDRRTARPTPPRGVRATVEASPHEISSP